MKKIEEKKLPKPFKTDTYWFTNALYLITGKERKNYLYDECHYDRILRWYYRTRKHLTDYLNYHQLTETAPNISEIFLHYLLVLYFQINEFGACNEENGYIKNFNLFISNCLRSHVPKNKKGHLKKRTVTCDELFSFFSLFSEISDEFLEDKFRLSDDLKTSVSNFDYEQHTDSNKAFYEFMCIFFKKD